MKQKIVSVILVVAMVVSMVVPGAAASPDTDLIYTQTAEYDGQVYTLEVYIDGSSTIYTEGNGGISALHFAPDGTATAYVESSEQTENYALDIENLSSEAVDFDVYETDKSVKNQMYLQNEVANDEPIISISSMEQLEAVISSPQTRAGVVTVMVVSLLTLVLVAVTLVAASRYINGVKHDYVSVIIDAVRALDDNAPRYFHAYLLQNDTDILINFSNPISRANASGTLRFSQNVYTFLSSDALAVVQSASQGTGYSYSRNPEIDANRLDGHIYYYHYHLLDLRDIHMAHAWFGLPYTK